jgi:hypothetical protein
MHKLILSFILVFLLVSCITGQLSKGTRNPIFKKNCPVHNTVLITDTVSNQFGAWCEIYFDSKKTPYPRVGICRGCVVYPPMNAKIKYCAVCDSIYLHSNIDTTGKN